MPIRSYQATVQVLVTTSSVTTVERTVEQALGLSQVAINESVVYDVEQGLNLVSEAVIGLPRKVADELALFQTANWLLDISNSDSINQVLDIQQDVSVFGYLEASNDLSLSSVAGLDIFGTEVIPQGLFLNSDVVYRFSVRNLSAQSEIEVVGDVTKVFIGNLEDALNLSSIAFRSFVGDSTLNLVQTISAGKGYDASNKITLAQGLILNKLLQLGVNTENVVTQSCTYFVESRCGRYTFNRFHGEGGKPPTAKRLNYPNRFYLQSIDDGSVVQLRNPETDDRQRYAFNRVNRTFFDGSTDIYVGEGSAVEESQVYTIVGTKRSDLELVYNFLGDNLGREIIIKDWKGVTWVVIVTNPGTLYTEDGEGYWTLEFEVEGSAFDGEWFISYLQLDQVNSRAGSIYNRGATHGEVVTDSVGRNYDEPLSSADVVSQDVSYTVV